MELINLVRAAIFCAMAIAVGYSLMMVPNIELITVTIFLSGLTLNAFWGATVGFVAMGIYSGLNPLGSGLGFPPLFLAQLISMSLCGVIGGFLKPFFVTNRYNISRLVLLGLSGLVVTLIYDVLTLISYPIFSGLGVVGVYAALVKGLGFTLLHQLSNAIIFIITVPRVVKFLTK